VTENVYIKVTKGKDPLLFEKLIFCDLQSVRDDDRGIFITMSANKR